MNQIRDLFRRNQPPVEPITPGSYSFQSPPDVSPHYRLHLRVEPGGNGLLVVNASTILHLNQTAAEYAYHLILGDSAEETARMVSERYQVKPEQALQDYKDLKERVHSLILMPDLDPISYLDFDRREPFSTQLSVPLRIDCALTYKTNHPGDTRVAPTDRVIRELNTDEWKIVLDKIWQAGVPHIVFTGGEPTLREDLPDLLMHAETHGQVTGLLSDGLRLADDHYREQLLNSGLDHLMLVLDPDVEGSWTGLSKVLPEDLFTTVHLTLTPDKLVQLGSVLDRLQAMGVNSISISAGHPDAIPSMQEARDEITRRELTLQWDIPVPYSHLNPVDLEVGEPSKGAGNVWMYIEPDGDVLPTQGVPQVLGNLVTQEWGEIQRMKDEG